MVLQLWYEATHVLKSHCLKVWVDTDTQAIVPKVRSTGKNKYYTLPHRSHPSTPDAKSLLQDAFQAEVNTKQPELPLTQKHYQRRKEIQAIPHPLASITGKTITLSRRSPLTTRLSHHRVFLHQR